ncbi:MAG: energy-coupling factor ABC transporter permease [Rubrivivax sp.]|nr:energy-coupling factor ABC transporter permease [Rubrivivax sp.]
MHMADALLSPAVGGAMWLASAATLALCARQLRARADNHLVPLMGVLGAFVFAAQMVNFAIPGTGSSGHLGGGLLLAVLLGPQAAVIVIASVLTVQALLFADGGLLALGANIFNLGVLPCLSWALVYRPLAATVATAVPRFRVTLAAVLAAVVGLQLGALAVVLQTVGSGIASLPLQSFMLMMLPIHLPIGLVEGFATAALVLFIRRAQPELLPALAPSVAPAASFRRTRRRLLGALAGATVLTGGLLSWFASAAPDGLEWAVERVAGARPPLAAQAGLHGRLGEVQAWTSVLPDYRLPEPLAPADAAVEAAWPAVEPGTSLAGLVGGGVTLLLVAAVTALLRRRRR